MVRTLLKKHTRGLALNPPPDGQPFKETETMTYTAPIKDMLFNMEHLAQIEQVAQLPGFEDAGLETAQAVLEECAKLCETVVAPLNVAGDLKSVEVSHQVSSILDVEDPISTEYNLEVSSPGMDRLLFKPSQYEKYLGEQVSLTLRMAVNNRRKYKGVITRIEGEMLVLVVDGNEETVAFANIQQANLVPNFD